METTERFENYPSRIVILSNLVSLFIYGLGYFIMFQLGLIFSVLFLIYILAFEYRLIRYHCINCYYWGKTCGFGKGRLSSLLFKKGDISKLCYKEMKWTDMIPDILVSLIPIIVGIVLLILKFNPFLLFALLLLAVLTTVGNGYIRGTLTCRYCKQRELGCPANNLFNKERWKDKSMKTYWMMSVQTACCLALFLCGCQQQQPDTRAADERAIREADSAWSAASGAKDLDRYLSYFAPDASIFPSNAPIVTGSETIRKAAVQYFATPGHMSGRTAWVEVSRGGDLGYASGTYEFTFNDAKGKPVTDRGKYLTVWKKQSDGKWKAVADMYNSDLPAAPTSKWYGALCLTTVKPTLAFFE
jgi:uncharacterized protein (TIGR02246 family)